MNEQIDNQGAYNGTYGNRASLVIPDLTATPFYLQGFQVPAIQFGTFKQPNPFTDVTIPGDKIQFAPLQLSIMLDENLTAYREIYNWIIGMGFPTDFREFREQPHYRLDGQILFTSNTLNPKPMRIKFLELFPSAISAVPYDFREAGAENRTIDVTFEYSFFQFE